MSRSQLEKNTKARRIAQIWLEEFMKAGQIRHSNDRVQASWFFCLRMTDPRKQSHCASQYRSSACPVVDAAQSCHAVIRQVRRCLPVCII
jgi:hypothetical protein